MRKLVLLSGLLGLSFLGCADNKPAPAPTPSPGTATDANKKDTVDTPATPDSGDAAPASADPGKAP
jgi:hypothetical protein